MHTRAIARSRRVALTVLLATGMGSSSSSAAVLYPSIIGSAYEFAPFDGVGDGTDDRALIGNINGEQRRTVLEFDLGGLPSGTIQSARVSGAVGPNNSNNTGTRSHRVGAYAGDGRLTTADYGATVTPLGTFSHASGGSSGFDYDIASILQQAWSSGASHFAVRIDPLNAQQGWDALHSLYPRPQITYTIAPPSNAQTLSLTPQVDAMVNFQQNPPAIRSSEMAINVQNIPTVVDRRAVMEFDIAGIPDDADIVSAQLKLDIVTITSSAGSDPVLHVHGYSGNGIVEAADGGVPANEIGRSDPILALDPITIDLDPAYVESLLSSTNFLGLLGLGDLNGQQIGFTTNEGAAFGGSSFAPTLVVNYVVPEPAALGTLAMAGLLLTRRRARR